MDNKKEELRLKLTQIKIFVDHNNRMSRNYLDGDYCKELLESNMKFSNENSIVIKGIIEEIEDYIMKQIN